MRALITFAVSAKSNFCESDIDANFPSIFKTIFSALSKQPCQAQRKAILKQTLEWLTINTLKNGIVRNVRACCTTYRLFSKVQVYLRATCIPRNSIHQPPWNF